MSQKNDRYKPMAEVSRHAAHWCLRLKELRRWSLAEGLQFVAWLARSRRHVEEFLFLRRLDDRLTCLFRAKGDRSNVTQVNFWRGSSLYPPEVQRRRHVAWSVGLITGVTVCVIFFIGTVNEELPPRTFMTAAQESTTGHLEDGSRVSLGSDSTLRVEFTDLRREVHFAQGTAMFDVAMDMKRPFVVNTAVVDIAAVESTFSVSIDRSVEVRVYDGIVAISRRGTKARAPVVTVKKGETYRVPVEAGGRMVAESGVPMRAPRMDG
jgi:ferric-dicitrate binding protein FerR (iron transport regulator)